MSTLFWGYFSRISSIASSLIIMPFALAQFSAETFSIWMVFVIFFSLIVVFDFGLTSTISRQYNYLLAGANSIERSGVSLSVTQDVNKELFSQLYHSSVIIFTSIAILVGILLLLVYWFYLKPITMEHPKSITIEWTLYSIAIFINLICLKYNAIFFGTNNVTSLYRISSLSNIVFFAIAISLILLNYELMAIALARICAAIVYFIHARYEVKSLKMLRHYDPKYKNGAQKVFKNLLPNAAKLGGVTLGNFLTRKASVLIVVAYLPLSDSGSYALALNIFSVILSICLLYMTVKIPLLNAYRQKLMYIQLLQLQQKIRLVCLTLGIAAFLSFMFLGEYVLNYIGSITQLPSLMTLALFTLLYLLELNRTISMNFIMSSNQVPFLKASLITGIACVGLTIVLFELQFTMIFVPVLVQLIAQTAFNNWYWTKQELAEARSLRRKGTYENIQSH